MALPLDNPIEEEDQNVVEEPKKPDDVFLSDDLSVEVRSLARSLGVENNSDLEHYKGRLESIVKWAAHNGAKDADDITLMARQLSKKIGGPNIGQNIIEHLSVYAKLEMQKSDIERKLNKYVSE